MRPCIVCGRDIPEDRGRNSHTCSQECSDAAYRARQRRKERRRAQSSEAYRAKRRRREWRRAQKRYSNPQWQAWRADVETRKQQRELAKQRRELASEQCERRKHQCEVNKLRCELYRLEITRPEYKRTQWRWQRLNKKRKNPELYRQATAARSQKRQALVNAIHEIGWNEADLFAGVHQPKAFIRGAILHKIVIVDSEGNAALVDQNRFLERRRYRLQKLMLDALRDLGLAPPSYQHLLKEKRERIAELLASMPGKSDREIAQFAGAGKTTVGLVRRDIQL